MKYLILLGLVAISLSSGANAQSERSSASLIDQLGSAPPQDRTEASRYIYGRGIDDVDVYKAVARAIETSSSTLSPESPSTQQQEVAWHAKALASSGNAEYMPILEELSESPAKTVAKHAKKSTALLQKTVSNGVPYLDPRNVTEIFEGQRANCELIDQVTCSTSFRMEKCRNWHKDKAAAKGANAIMLLREDGGALRRTNVANYFKCDQSDLASPELIAVTFKDDEQKTLSYIDELKELAALRDDGIITEDEFQRKKAEVLAR
jgi:hypothetical protein